MEQRAFDEAEQSAADIARVARGDTAALGAIYDRTASLVFAVAMRVTGDRAMAEDVVQETFVGVWKNAPRFDAQRAPFRSWLLTITHHRAVDALRKRARPDASLDADGSLASTLVGPADVHLEVTTRLDRAAVRGTLARLPALQRECVELAYFSGLTQAEIAARTGAPLGTVKSRVRTGLLRLRELMTASPDAEPVAPSAPFSDVATAWGRPVERGAAGAGATTPPVS